MCRPSQQACLHSNWSLCRYVAHSVAQTTLRATTCTNSHRTKKLNYKPQLKPAPTMMRSSKNIYSFRVSLVQLFVKVHNEKLHFQKAECLVKTIKKYFLKKLSVWLAFIKVTVWGINYQKEQCIYKEVYFILFFFFFFGCEFGSYLKINYFIILKSIFLFLKKLFFFLTNIS